MHISYLSIIPHDEITVVSLLLRYSCFMISETLQSSATTKRFVEGLLWQGWLTPMYVE